MAEQGLTPKPESSAIADPPLSRASFDSDHFPGPERSNAYQTLVAGTARLTPLAEPFFAKFKSYVAGPLRFNSVEAIPHRFERPGLKIAFDRADYLVIQYIVQGEVEGDCDGRPIYASTGSVYCLDFRRPSLLVEKMQTRLRYVTVTRLAALESFGNLHALHGAVFSRAQAASYIACLERTYAKLDAMRESAVPGVVTETLAELRALFAGVIEPHGRGLRSRAQAHIAARLGSRDLKPEKIAKALGISRSQLYVVFRDCGGVSRYIWNQRLKKVHAALITSGETRTLTELAVDFGFANQAHLSSLFRRVYGATPTRVRQIGKGELTRVE